MKPDLLNILSLDLPAFIIGITIHEFCHAFAADRLGDPGPRQKGRISLNPLRHLDPIGTILPLFLMATGFPLAFGWGKPVKVDPAQFKNPNRGFGIVALAGPIGNLLVCLILGLFLRISPTLPALLKAMTNPTGNFIYRVIFRVFALNLALFLFNLLPIPPLDGSKVLMWLGGNRAKAFYQTISPLALLLLIGFLLSGMDKIIIVPMFIKFTQVVTGPMARYLFSPVQFIADFLY